MDAINKPLPFTLSANATVFDASGCVTDRGDQRMSKCEIRDQPLSPVTGTAQSCVLNFCQALLLPSLVSTGALRLYFISFHTCKIRYLLSATVIHYLLFRICINKFFAGQKEGSVGI